MTLTFTNRVISFDTAKDAMDYVSGLALVGDGLFDANGAQLLGMDNEAVAYYAGSRVQKKEDRLTAEELVDKGITLYEHRVQKGEIKTAQIGAAEKSRVDQKLKGLGAIK